MAIDNITKDMLSLLPSWMEMRNEDSLGAKFMNIPGLKIKELEAYIKHELDNAYIGSADVLDIDIIYKMPIDTKVLYPEDQIVFGFMKSEDNSESNGTRYLLIESKTVSDFYEGDSHKVIIDVEKSMCYFRKKYEFVIINGTLFHEIVLHHVWNRFDEFGLLLNCPRLYGESNIEYRQRLLDVFNRPGSADRTGLTNALSRELGVPSEDISVNSLADTAFKNSLLDENGNPTSKLIEYARKVNDVMSMTWGEALWDRGYWTSINSDNVGLDYLPHIWDAPTTGWLDTDFQSGIGSGKDLYVEAPTKESDTQEFNYYVGLAGMKYEQKEIYPPHSFKFKLTANGTTMSKNIIPEEYFYTIIAAPRIPLIFRIRAEKEYEQKPVTNFENATIYNRSNLNGLSNEAKRNSYIASDSNKIEIVDGTSVPNPTQRYIEIGIEMETNDDGTLTPDVDSVTLTWTTNDDITKSITIDTQDGESVIGNDYKVGFTSNTWSDTSPVIRVENDNINVDASASGHLTLGRGSYYKVIDTEGDWNRSNMMTNVVITGDGDIRLSNIDDAEVVLF